MALGSIQSFEFTYLLSSL